MPLSFQQQYNVDEMSAMKDPLCNWDEATGRTTVMLTCFFAHAGEHTVIVPQKRYRPPSSDWHSVSEQTTWESEHQNPYTLTFYTDGKFGINLEEALCGEAEVTSRLVDDVTNIDPQMSLHLMWPGCSPCCIPMACDSAFDNDGVVDLAILGRTIAEKIEVFLQDRPDIIDPNLFCQWDPSNVQLKDITLIQLKNVSHKNGWQPVLAIKQKPMVVSSTSTEAFPPLDDIGIPDYTVGGVNPSFIYSLSDFDIHRLEQMTQSVCSPYFPLPLMGV
ncbi:hypothetical protein BDY19DRAFT_237759 [Irpex rosettiformis]|uniref:Uncharacterized protein n=1 Tax=Irpex rosettiformis TaxID=378272 RepID=A0ACB8TZQ9_9APHY|nr:hypothetical protein BDY19DRAFT_237759 [Irpex rosettiformis]